MCSLSYPSPRQYLCLFGLVCIACAKLAGGGRRSVKTSGRQIDRMVSPLSVHTSYSIDLLPSRNTTSAIVM